MVGSAGVGQSRGSTRQAARHQLGQASQYRSKSPCHSDTPPGSALLPSGPGSHTASSWSESHPGHRQSDEILRPHKSEKREEEKNNSELIYLNVRLH